MYCIVMAGSAVALSSLMKKTAITLHVCSIGFFLFVFFAYNAFLLHAIKNVSVYLEGQFSKSCQLANSTFYVHRI